MYLPHLKIALPVRRYRMGDFAATLLSDCESTSDEIDYAHILVVYQMLDSSSTARPSLVISSETNPEARDAGYYFLCTMGGLRRNYGASRDWADLAKFEKAALQVAGQVLAITDPPQLLADHQAP